MTPLSVSLASPSADVMFSGLCFSPESLLYAAEETQEEEELEKLRESPSLAMRQVSKLSPEDFPSGDISPRDICVIARAIHERIINNEGDPVLYIPRSSFVTERGIVEDCSPDESFSITKRSILLVGNEKTGPYALIKQGPPGLNGSGSKRAACAIGSLKTAFPALLIPLVDETARIRTVVMTHTFNPPMRMIGEEYQITRKVHSPHVFKLIFGFDSHVDEGTYSYGVQKPIQILPTLSKESDLDSETILSILAGIIEGVAALHKEEIIHRDLKPDNMGIDIEKRKQGVILAGIFDFGEAADLRVSKGKMDVTNTNSFCLSPETLIERRLKLSVFSSSCEEEEALKLKEIEEVETAIRMYESTLKTSFPASLESQMAREIAFSSDPYLITYGKPQDVFRLGYALLEFVHGRERAFIPEVYKKVSMLLSLATDFDPSKRPTAAEMLAEIHTIQEKNRSLITSSAATGASVE